LAEKLIVKNFGPIKHVELDIKKVNVLIGEQGTGKSALVRLVNYLTTKNFLFGNKNYTTKEFEEDFFFENNFMVNYTSPDFQIKYNPHNGFDIEFIGKNHNQLQKLGSLYKKFIENHDTKYEEEYYSLSDWYSENIIRDVYVPAERIAITSMDSWNINRDNLDQYIVKFFGNFHSARERNTEFKIPHLKNVTYKRENGEDRVVFNNENLPLRATSSGFQSSIPLAVFIEYFTSIKDKIRFIIEEPELNLFPTTQYDLMKYLIEKTSPDKNGLFLATHSPYILSSINNMMYAFQMGKIDLERTSRILDKKYWLNPDVVSAYYLKSNGEIENIMDYEIMQINGEKIDSASEIINDEYDKMLGIKYRK
jgi:predicted ATPase